MFERNLLATRFLSTPLVVLSPLRKNFRVSEMLSAENLEHPSVSSYPARCPACKSLLKRKKRKKKKLSLPEGLPEKPVSIWFARNCFFVVLTPV